MIEYLAAAFLVLAFIGIVKYSRIVENSIRAIAITRQSFADLRDEALDDDLKEAAMQTHAKRLFGLFFLISISGFAALFLPVAVIWVCDRLAWLDLNEVLGLTLSWQFLLASTIIVCLVLVLARRFKE